MAPHNDFGRRAERMAAALLERNGWTILERNWRVGRREIDLIARNGTVVAFVEVKARRSDRYGHPLQAIDRPKRRGLAFAARVWLERHARPGDAVRFDAVHVLRAAGGLIATHVENAWLDDSGGMLLAGPSGRPLPEAAPRPHAKNRRGEP